MRALFVVLLAGAVSLTDAASSQGGPLEGPPVESSSGRVAEAESGPVSTCVSWVQRADGPGRANHAAVWDSVRNQIVMHGGRSSPTCYEGDTWTWDGTTWSVLAPFENGPGRSEFVKMAFDAGRGVAVMYQTYKNVSSIPCETHSFVDGAHETWEWNGAAWAFRSADDPPGLSQTDNELFYDPVHGRVLSYGGYDFSSCVPTCPYYYPNDNIWTWNGSSWNFLTSGEPLIVYAPIVLDEDRGVAVMFGGCGSNVPCDTNDTWEWNGASWTKRFPSTSPPAREFHKMAYDGVRHVMMLTGGIEYITNVNGNVLNDTWEYDGTDWRQVAVANSYSPRFGPIMVFDKLRGVMVMQGGVTAGVDISTYELHRSEITLQPHDVIAGLGDNVQLAVGAQATSPATYQWHRNGQVLADGGRISGATTGTLHISGAQPSDSGPYDVSISTLCGGSQSAQASLTVLSTPIPAASNWSLAAMIAGTLAAGIAVLRRRALA
jgi:hypothetical protein